MSFVAKMPLDSYRAALEIHRAIELPTLVGTAKQAAWATDIRSKFVTHLLAVRFTEGRPGSRDTAWLDRGRHGAVLEVEQIMPLIAAQTSATWWIDHRSHEPLEVWELLGYQRDRLALKQAYLDA